MDKGNITNLLEVYNQCKDLNRIYSTNNLQKAIMKEYEIIKSAMPIDNLFCVMLDQKDKASHYYSAKKIDENKAKKYLHLFKEENHGKRFVIEGANTLILPILNDDTLLGYYSFIRRDKDWSNDSIDMLENIIRMFIFFYSHNNDYQTQFYKNDILLQILETIHGNICLTDPKTGEVLYMNKNMCNAYHINNPVGMKCWQVIHNQKERCSYCPIEHISENTLHDYTWEHTVDIQDKQFLNYNCMIDWIDHRPVHLLHSVDITELKQIQKDAMYDDLTNIFNRRTGKNELENLIKNAKKNNENVVVCLFDTDNLKHVNDSFGHSEGDFMLKTITKEIKKTLNDLDIFFRLSGDEFIVGYYNLTQFETRSKMKQALTNLKEIQFKNNLKYNLSFCFGIYEVTPNLELSINEIIDYADEAMYNQKKKSHLRTSVYNFNHYSSVVDEFDYNKNLLYEALAKSSDDYLFICNLKTNTFKYTPEFVKEFNFPGEILKNASVVFSSKIHKDDKYEFLNGNQLILDGRTDSHIIEYRALNRNNEWVWLRCRGHVAYDENGEASIFAGFISNLGKKNYRDPLTGLYNKFEFEKRINESVGHFSVIILNINGFSKINQLYNRDFGDQVLRIIGQNLQSMLHKETTVFKLDGDEFAFILKETNPTIIHELFQKIQNYASDKHTYNGKNFTCSFTAGAALSPRDGTNYLELRKCCGTALNYAKLFNRNHLSFFTTSLLEKETYSLQLLSSLQEDINTNYSHFHLVYQPKVASFSQNLVGFEALCRWRHSDFPNISPGTFIPLLEGSNDIIALGRWIFDESVKQLKEWLELYPTLTMNINVSYIQLSESDFIPFIKSVIEYYEVPFENIIIELTETAITKNIQLIIDSIKEIRALGIKIAMDDFGKGYSSLSLLKEEPLDIIKIDQSFVRNIKTDKFNSALIKFIVELCHQINLKVTVEGIETQEELELIEQFNPDFIQGYYTGRPMEVDQCLEFIQQNIDIQKKLV